MHKDLKHLIAFGTLFNAIRLLIGAISVVYMLDNGLTIHDVGWIKSFQAAIIFVLDIPLSHVADKHSRKLSLIVGTVFAAAWLLQMALATSVWQFYLAEFFNAISLSLYGGAFVALLIDTKNDHHPDMANNIILGKFYKHQTLLMAVSAFLGAAFVATHSRGIWLVAFGLMMALLLLYSWRIPADRHEGHQNAQEKSLRHLGRDLALIFRTIGQDKVLFYATLAFVMINFYFQTILQFWQPIFAATGFKRGIAFGSIFAVILLCQTLASWCMEKYPSTAPRWGLWLIVAAPIMLMVAKTVHGYATIALIVLSVCLLFWGAKMCQIHAMAQFHNHVGKANRATFDSVASLFNRILMMLVFPVITLSTQSFVLWFGVTLLVLFGIYGVMNKRYQVTLLARK